MTGNDATSPPTTDDSALGIAVLGFWHVHADDYAREVAEHPGTRLVAAWDPDAVRGREGAERLGVEFVADLDELLARPDVAGVTVTTATAEHPVVIRAALEAGRHVFTEKLLAGSTADAEELVTLAERLGLALVVSLPRLSDALAVTVRRLVCDGAIGDVTYARVRMAHDGWIGGWLPERFADPAAALGGALTDLGCHPVYLVQDLLGSRPESVRAAYGRVRGREVDDNAVVTMGYADGAIGVAEASFVTTPGAFALEVRGTAGSLLYGFGREALIGKGGSLGDTWAEIPLDDPDPTPFASWVDAMHTGARPVANSAAAIELTRLVERANAAAQPVDQAPRKP
jgi:1,5-anhydro-D-fructose reductase (1,5-anhydro-D-mannitol-forming)